MRCPADQSLVVAIASTIFGSHRDIKLRCIFGRRRRRSTGRRRRWTAQAMHPAIAKTAVQPPDAAQPEKIPATIEAPQRPRPQPPISGRTGPPVPVDGTNSLKQTGFEKTDHVSAASTATRRGTARADAMQSGRQRRTAKQTGAAMGAAAGGTSGANTGHAAGVGPPEVVDWRKTWSLYGCLKALGG